MKQTPSNAFDLSKKVSAFSSDPKFNGYHDKKRTMKTIEASKSPFNTPIVNPKTKRTK